MAFRNKDLLVNLLPTAGIDAEELARICLFRTNICRHPTFCFHRTCMLFGSFNCGICSFRPTFGCGILNSCGFGGSACDPSFPCAGGSEPFVIENLEDLVTLRGELRETLTRLEQMEKEGIVSGFRTAAEAEAAEKRLTEALEHVRQQRKNLK